jgi:hypothetical protein
MESPSQNVVEALGVIVAEGLLTVTVTGTEDAVHPLALATVTK